MPHYQFNADDWVVNIPASGLPGNVLGNPLHVGRGQHNYNDWADVDKACFFDLLNRSFHDAAAPIPQHDLMALAHPSHIKNKEDRKKTAAFTSAVLEGLVSTSLSR